MRIFSNEPEKVRSLHIGIRTQSEVSVSLKLMLLNLLVVQLNAGWVPLLISMESHMLAAADLMALEAVLAGPGPVQQPEVEVFGAEAPQGLPQAGEDLRGVEGLV